MLTTILLAAVLDCCDIQCKGLDIACDTPCKCAETDITGRVCDLPTVLAALREAVPLLTASTDSNVIPAIYRTPANQLRRAADEMEQRDAVVERVRKVLAACEGK